MPTSYSSRLRLAKPATGELNNTWGDVVNQNITDMVDQAIAGVGSIALTDANYTLTTNNGTSDDARNAVLNFTGALTANRTITAPAVSKLYVVRNATTGGFSLLMSSGGAAVTVASGQTMLCYTNGTDFFEVSRTAFTTLSATLLTATLAANLDANSNRVVNLAAPIAGGDATNKTYVDALVVSATAPSFAVTTSAVNKTLIAFESCRITADNLVITLPAAPVAGTTRCRVVIGGSFYNTTIGRNGNNIGGLAEDCTIPYPNIVVTWFYQDATIGWVKEG